MNWSYIMEVLPRFIDAALLTLQLSFWGIIGSLLLGIGVAILTAYRLTGCRLAQSYVELSRNTPLLIQLFFSTTAYPKSVFIGTALAVG